MVICCICSCLARWGWCSSHSAAKSWDSALPNRRCRKKMDLQDDSIVNSLCAVVVSDGLFGSCGHTPYESYAFGQGPEPPADVAGICNHGRVHVNMFMASIVRRVG